MNASSSSRKDACAIRSGMGVAHKEQIAPLRDRDPFGRAELRNAIGEHRSARHEQEREERSIEHAGHELGALDLHAFEVLLEVGEDVIAEEINQVVLQPAG